MRNLQRRWLPNHLTEAGLFVLLLLGASFTYGALVFGAADILTAPQHGYAFSNFYGPNQNPWLGDAVQPSDWRLAGLTSY